MVELCDKLPPYCTKTVDKCLYSHRQSWIWINCNLKKVSPTFFKFSHFYFQNRLEQTIISSFFKNGCLL